MLARRNNRLMRRGVVMEENTAKLFVRFLPTEPGSALSEQFCPSETKLHGVFVRYGHSPYRTVMKRKFCFVELDRSTLEKAVQDLSGTTQQICEVDADRSVLLEVTIAKNQVIDMGRSSNPVAKRKREAIHGPECSCDKKLPINIYRGEQAVQKGDLVTLKKPKSGRGPQRYIVQSEVLSADTSHDAKLVGCVELRPVDNPCGSPCYHWPSELSRVEQSPQVLVTRTTQMYCAIARRQTDRCDACIEIGCDFGGTTRVLAQTAGYVVGIDKATDHVEQALEEAKVASERKEEWPLRCHFVAGDVLENSFVLKDAAVLALEETKKRYAEHGTNKRQKLRLVVLIDINGNRPLAGVQDCLQVVNSTISADLIIVKSTALCSHIEKP